MGEKAMSTEVEFATVTVWFRDPSDGTTDIVDAWEFGDDADAFISNVNDQLLEVEDFKHFEYWLEVVSSDVFNGTYPVNHLEEIVHSLS
jgi:predicted kinase